MSERHEPGELTEHDLIAWFEVHFRLRARHGSTLFTRSLMQDRRDAELMWGWQCQEMETLHMSQLERLLWLGIGLEVRA